MFRWALLAVMLLAAVPPNRQPPSLTVSAATSLTDVLESIAQAYATGGGGPVRLNFAGSNTLARQIVNGAPADVFISADEVQMDVVERAGYVRAGTRTVIARNQLVVLAAPELADAVRENFQRGAPEIRRLALGDPAAVPAGVYARQYLERQGLWTLYESRIVPTANVRAAVVAVETGAADAAIVYRTDIAVARRAVAAFLVPFEAGPLIEYPAAVLAGSRHPDEARRFLAFLRGAEASAIFARFKFLPLER